ncbi:hypothetical protein KP717_09115, partial [Staphylococcus aureus]
AGGLVVAPNKLYCVLPPAMLRLWLLNGLSRMMWLSHTPFALELLWSVYADFEILRKARRI